MTGRVECRYYGRDFTAGEIALLRALIAVDPQPTRAGLSREFCRRIGWFNSPLIKSAPSDSLVP